MAVSDADAWPSQCESVLLGSLASPANLLWRRSRYHTGRGSLTRAYMRVGISSFRVARYLLMLRPWYSLATVLFSYPGDSSESTTNSQNNGRKRMLQGQVSRTWMEGRDLRTRAQPSIPRPYHHPHKVKMQFTVQHLPATPWSLANPNPSSVQANMWGCGGGGRVANEAFRDALVAAISDGLVAP